MLNGIIYITADDQLQNALKTLNEFLPPQACTWSHFATIVIFTRSLKDSREKQELTVVLK